MNTPQGPGELWLYGDEPHDDKLMIMVTERVVNPNFAGSTTWRCVVIETNSRAKLWTTGRQNRFMFDWSRDGRYLTLFSRP